MWHRDFPVWCHEIVKVPRTAWVNIEQGNELEFGLPSFVQIVVKACSLQIGDIVLFDGWVPHRGVACDKSLVAVHAYLDVPEVERERNLEVNRAFIRVSGYTY